MVALLAAGLSTTGCELGEADVVGRSPDLGPPLAPPPSRDASGLGGSGGDAAGGTGGSPDSNIPLKDARDAFVARPDAASADATTEVPAADGKGLVTDGMDAALQPEAGSLCSEPGFVLCDDFEDGTTGWEWSGTSWAVSEDGSSEEKNTVFGPDAADASKAIFTLSRWQDMTVEVRMRVLSFGEPTSSNRAEVYARYQSGEALYAVSLRGDGKLGLRKNAIGLGSVANVAVPENQWRTLAIRVSGAEGAISLEGYLDGRLVVAALDTDSTQGGPGSAMGAAGLGVYGNTLAVFDDLKVSSP